MRIAILSDIHGNLAALEAVAADIRRRGVDQIVNLGDSLSGPLLPLQTAQYLMAEAWLSLAGNHERQILTHGPERRGASDEYAYSQLTHKEITWLATLPATTRLAPDVFLCHGTPTSDMEYFLETVQDGTILPARSYEIESRLAGERALVLACGHTHMARSVRTRSGQLIVNPGSVGLPAYRSDLPSPHTVEAGSPDARYAIIEKAGNEWAACLFCVPYEHRPMAELAKLRNRPEWAHALLCGYLP